MSDTAQSGNDVAVSMPTPVGFTDHVRRRFLERYRLVVGADDLRRMVECIRRGEAVLLKPDVGGNRSLYATPRPSRKGKRTKLAPVVYDANFGAIVTVLPEEVLRSHWGAVRRFREKRVAELGAESWPLKFPAEASGARRREDVRLALAADQLCYHVHCGAGVCPFPVSLYVRNVGGHGARRLRREVVYLKANGFSASSHGAGVALLREQFRKCLAVRTGVVPANAGALTDAFLEKLAVAMRSERLAWSAWRAERPKAAA